MSSFFCRAILFIMVLQSSVQSESRGTTGRRFRLGSSRRQGDTIPTDMSGLMEISDNARLDSIRVMTALSQRLAPIPRSVSEPTPSFTVNTTINRTPTRSATTQRRPASFFCQGALLLQQGRNLRAEDICTRFSSSCKYCNGDLWALPEPPEIQTIWGLSKKNWRKSHTPEIQTIWGLSKRFWYKSHTPVAPGSTFVDFGCIFCDSVEVFICYGDLAKHLLDYHQDNMGFITDCDISPE